MHGPPDLLSKGPSHLLQPGISVCTCLAAPSPVVHRPWMDIIDDNKQAESRGFACALVMPLKTSGDPGEEEANMDLAALIKDGQVAWLHAADIPPDLRTSQPSKTAPAPKALSTHSKFPAAPDPAGELPHA